MSDKNTGDSSGTITTTSDSDPLDKRIQNPTETAPPPQRASSASQSKTGPAPISLKLLSWNVESEGADSGVIGSQLAAMKGYDIYALCEVLPQDFKRFRTSLGQKYRYAYSKTGNNDRLQILYDTDRFELVRQMELDEINFERRYRSPLVVHLKDRESGVQFMVVNNHLARGKAEIRTRQAEQLVDWARDQTVPLLAVGDYNFDFVFSTSSGNDGFRAMLRDNIWKWVKPTEMIDSNWYDPEPDGIDNYPGSLLDFVFVAGSATEWNTICNVIVRDGDFPDDASTSDHRPVELLITN